MVNTCHVTRIPASDWAIPGQVGVGDVEGGQVGEAGGQGTQVEAAEVVGAHGQGLQPSQAWDDDVLSDVRVRPGRVQVGTSNVT